MGLRDRIKKPGSGNSDRPPAQPKREPLLEEAQAPPRIPPPQLAEPPEAPRSVAPITMVIDDDALQSGSAGQAPRMPGPADLSPAGVSAMSPQELVSAAVAELRAHRISDEDGFMDAKALRPLYKSVRDNGLLEQVLAKVSEADARAENPTRAENMKAPPRQPPPPPPRRSSMPPRLAEPPKPSSGITGEEATVAADPMVMSVRQPAGAEGLADAMAIRKLIKELREDFGLTTQQRLDTARVFYDGQLNLVLRQFEGDDAKLRKFIVSTKKSAASKAEKGQPLSQIEDYVMALTSLSSYVADLDMKRKSELEFADLQKKRKSNLGMPRMPSPDREAAPKPPAQSIDPPDLGDAPAEARPPRPPPKQPSPERPSKRPPSPERKNGEEKEEARVSENPHPANGNGRKRMGAFARTMLSPITWTVLGVGGFTAAMLAVHGFDEIASLSNLGMARIPSIAPYIRRVWEGWLHLPPVESAAGIMTAYYGLTGLGIAGGLYRKYRRVRKKTRELEELGIGEENFQRMRNYVVPILHRIFDEYSEGTYPKKLRTKLIEDPKFFMYMEEFYQNPAKFTFIMKEADVPPKQVAKFHVVFSDAENEIVKLRLEDYVRHIDDPGLRLTYLRETYESDPLFRKKLDEIFLRNIAGDYVNPRKQTDVAKALGNGDGEKGVPILKKLDMDYLRLREKKEKK